MARLLRPSDMLFRYESRSKMPTCQKNRSYMNQVNNYPPPIDTPFKRKIDIFSQCVTVKSACCGLVAGHPEKHLRTRSTSSKLQWGFVGKLLKLGIVAHTQVNCEKATGSTHLSHSVPCPSFPRPECKQQNIDPGK
ncbi:hypothetical protein HUJ04_009744 [Dendroctonus ponderosae]|nr:hypothetical protein HUJ04_009744 [Dendroctonus ponderosae]